MNPNSSNKKHYNNPGKQYPKPSNIQYYQSLSLGPGLWRQSGGGEVGGFAAGGVGGVRHPYPANQHPQSGANQPQPNQQQQQLRSQGAPQPSGANLTISHNQVIQAGQPGLGNQNSQVPSVPPGASPAPSGPHDINPAIPPGSTQQGPGGPIAVVSAGPTGGAMMFQSNVSSQPQGQQHNTQSFYSGNHANQNPPHIQQHPSGQRQVIPGPHMNIPVMQMPYQIPGNQNYFYSVPQYVQRPNAHSQFSPVGHPQGNYMPQYFSQMTYSGNNHQHLKQHPVQEKRQKKVLEIVDPNTGKNILSDIMDQEASSQDKSSNSADDRSARNTPALTSSANSTVMEFATKVATLANTDNNESENVEQERTTNKTSEINCNITRPNSDTRQISKSLDNCNNVCSISEPVVTVVSDSDHHQQQQHLDSANNSIKYTSNTQDHKTSDVNNDLTSRAPPPQPQRLPVVMQQAPPPLQKQRSPAPVPHHHQQQNMIKIQGGQYMGSHQGPQVNNMTPPTVRHAVETSVPPPKIVGQVPRGPTSVPPPQQEPVTPEIMELVKPRNKKESSPVVAPVTTSKPQTISYSKSPAGPHTATPPTMHGIPDDAAPGLPTQPSPAPTVVAQPAAKEPTPEPTRPSVQKPVTSGFSTQGSSSVVKNEVNYNDANKRNVANHVNNDDSRRSNSAYRGRKSKDKYGRRGKGPASPPPPPQQQQQQQQQAPVPRDAAPVASSTENEAPLPVPSEAPVPVQAPVKEPSVEPVKPPAPAKVKSVPPSTEAATPEPVKQHTPTPPPPQPTVVNNNVSTPTPPLLEEVKSQQQQPPPPVDHVVKTSRETTPSAEPHVVAPKIIEPPVPTPKIIEPPKLVEEMQSLSINDAQVNNHSENHNHEEETLEHPDKTTSMKFKEVTSDQWSPQNTSGKKQYDRRFLLDLQNNPLSKKRPESLPNLEVVLQEITPNMNKMNNDRSCFSSMLNNSPDVLAPNYVKGTKSSSKGKTLNNRPSYSGKNTPKMIPHVIRFGSNEFRKLQISENAWRPRGKDNKQYNSNEEAETVDTLKKVRGILNKLTPDNFKKLLDDIKALPISQCSARLSGVIDLIFEKAVDEQAFSTTYAQLCEALSISVKVDNAKAEKTFRFNIISRCQKEFEKDTMEELREKWDKDIDAEQDPDKKEELKLNYEYKEMILRKRSVGNIRFIGELYKLRMLNSVIMMRIIERLLSKADPESLECLCKLLTTIGAILENQASSLQPKAMDELNARFNEMQKIINNKETTSRVRFLMMDVIDLRQNNWVARREETKPKTKAQVLEEVKREEEEALLAMNTASRRDDRTKRNSRDTRPLCDDGWTMQSSRARQNFDSNRLKNNSNFSKDGLSLGKELTLGRPSFGNWQFGSHGGNNVGSQDHPSESGNRFNVLSENMHNDDRWQGSRLNMQGGSRSGMSFGSKSMPPPFSDKESVLSAVKQIAGPVDRSRVTQRSRETSLNRETEGELKGDPKLKEDLIEKSTKSIIEEFATISDFEEAKTCVTETFHTKTISRFVQYAVEWVLDKDKTKRKLVGELFSFLIKNNILLKHQFLEGNSECIALIEDYVIDVPQICEYYGELLAPLVVDKILSPQQLHDMSLKAEEKKADLLACVLFKASELKPQSDLAAQWKESGLDWANIVSNNTNVEEFINKHKLGFLTSQSTPQEKVWSLDAVKKELSNLFKRSACNEDIMRWIENNMSGFYTSNKTKFIRALITVLVESYAITSRDGSSITTNDEFSNKLKTSLPIVVKYVDGNEALEMQCLYELQALSVRHQHPAGMLEKLFNAFYENEVISEDTFNEWESDTNIEEQEGKGVCVKSVHKFLNWLKQEEDQPA